jgi:sarcosine oxidase subunit beta
MMAPIVGKLLAESIVSGRPEPRFDAWRLGRFREGKLLSESMILG